tara:strand:+ start:451 stop:834 length:384 start_codon:yes stop_codon:yes gene_type:complete
MKKMILTTTLCLVISVSNARTWTSADGSRTFDGEIRSYDTEKKAVSVLSSGRVLTFTEDKISEADLTYIREWEAEQNAPDPAELLATTEVGSKILKSKLQRLDGKRYKRAELDKAPEFYILYYSASW